MSSSIPLTKITKRLVDIFSNLTTSSSPESSLKNMVVLLHQVETIENKTGLKAVDPDSKENINLRSLFESISEEAETILQAEQGTKIEMDERFSAHYLALKHIVPENLYGTAQSMNKLLVYAALASHELVHKFGVSGNNGKIEAVDIPVDVGNNQTERQRLRIYYS